jgi:hypothetical protein
MSDNCRLKHEAVAQEFGRISARLERGDDTFERDSEKRQCLELKTQTMVHELREWCVTNLATKDELRDIGTKLEQARSERAAILERQEPTPRRHT